MDTKQVKRTLSPLIEGLKASLSKPKGNPMIASYNAGKLMALFRLNLISLKEYRELDTKYGTDAQWTGEGEDE